MGLLQRAWVEKAAHRTQIQLLSGKETVLGATVSKEGYADNLIEHESTHHNWLPWKRCNCKQCFLIPTPNTKWGVRGVIFKVIDSEIVVSEFEL